VPNTPDTAFIEALTWLGLTESEAKLFSILADTPPPGGTLASLAGSADIPRSTAHSALRALAKRGLIFCRGRYPERFLLAPTSRFATLAAVQEENLRRSVAATAIVKSRLRKH